MSLSVCDFRDGRPLEIICHVDGHESPTVLPPSLSSSVSFFLLVSPSPLLIHEIETVGVRSSVPLNGPQLHPLLIRPTSQHSHTHSHTNVCFDTIHLLLMNILFH